MDIALIASRFVHFAATMTLFGASFFAAALAPASLADDLKPLMRRLTLPLALLALASAVAWLVFVTCSMAGDVDVNAVQTVLTDTAFGTVWQVRLAILVLLVIAAWRPDRRRIVPAVLAGLAMASLGLVGHAAMQEGALGIAHRLNHAVHLLTTSAWLGGLLPFFVCLGLFVKSRDRRDALAAMMRYSRFGHFVVAAVFVSGALDVAMTVHAVPLPANTPYRILLDTKILVFFTMTALALFNRYVLAPQIGRSATAARALAVGTVVQTALALAAVSLVSAFATFNPNPVP